MQKDLSLGQNWQVAGCLRYLLLQSHGLTNLRLSDCQTLTRRARSGQQTEGTWWMWASFDTSEATRVVSDACRFPLEIHIALFDNVNFFFFLHFGASCTAVSVLTKHHEAVDAP